MLTIILNLDSISQVGFNLKIAEKNGTDWYNVDCKDIGELVSLDVFTVLPPLYFN